MDIIVSICYTLVLMYVIKWIFMCIYDRWRYNYPPGPRGWPFIGNTFNMDILWLHTTLADHKRKYGDVSHYNFAGKRFIVLNSIDAIKEALARDEYKVIFAGRPKTFFGDYYMRNSIFQTSYSKKWVKMRKIVQTSLKMHGNELRELEIIVTSELTCLKNALGKRGSEAFDWHENLTQSIGNILFIAIIGKRYDYCHESHKFMGQACSGASRLMNPWTNGIMTMFPFIRHFPFGSGKVYQNAVQGLDEITRYMYNEVEDDASNADKKGYLFELLKKQRENAWVTDDDVRKLVADIILAGIVSTTATLYSLFLILIHRQDVQKRIQEEIEEVVGKNRDPCLDDQSRMPYAQAVILETLRYAANIPIFPPHLTTRDVTFRGYRLKKDTIVLCNNWSVTHDEDLWDDPWEFRPERFLDDKGLILPPDHPRRRNMIAFSLGVRRCMGEVFARNRMFLFVVHLCQRFTFFGDHMSEMPSMDPREYMPRFTLIPKSYKIKLFVRNASTNLKQN